MARSAKHTLEFAARVQQLAQGRSDAGSGSANLVGPWFSSASAALYLDQPSRKAFRIWASRHGVVGVRKGGLLRYAKADIDKVPNVVQRSA